MSFPILKFNHRYQKLGNLKTGDFVTLCHVIETRYEDLPEEFRHWDTLYMEGREEKHYLLPEGGLCLLLIFWASGFFFTTIRDWDCTTDPEKADRYTGRIGTAFELAIQ